MALLSVAYNVDDTIFLKVSAPICRHSADEVDRLYIITIDMENGCVDSLRNVGAVGSRACETRIRRKAYLVIDDDMNGSTS